MDNIHHLTGFFGQNGQPSYHVLPTQHESGLVRHLREARPRSTTTSRSPAGITRSRIAKSTPAKRKTNRKKQGNAQIIPGPLSQLTQNSSIPVRDVDALVNRPLAERRQEAADRKDGKTPRPLNSFMLYRTAYAERTKEYAAATNHQVVSTVVGASWKQEPAEVRSKFEEWAVVEKEMHKRAFPSYKYTPGRPNVAHDEESDDEADPDAGDSDAEYIPSRGRGTRSRPRRQAHDAAVVPSYQSGPAVPDAYTTDFDQTAYSFPYAPQQVAQMNAPYMFNQAQAVYGQFQSQPYPIGSQPAYGHTVTTTTAPWLIQQRNVEPAQQTFDLGLQQRRRLPSLTRYQWPSSYAHIPRMGQAQDQMTPQISPTGQLGAAQISPTGMTYLASLLDTEASMEPANNIDHSLLSNAVGAAYNDDLEESTRDC